MALIDKETIRKEIEAWIKDTDSSQFEKGERFAYNKVLGLLTTVEMSEKRVEFLDTLPEQPVEWKDEYREEDLRTRFAFYTYKNEEDDSVLYLSNVFVEEASRNAGFGTKILEAAEKVAETIGASTIRLKVKQDSPANAWYRKRGYGYIAFEGEYDWLEKNLEYLKPKRNEQPVLPGTDEEGIPGRDFIPVEWVDACERYGKWKIVQKVKSVEGLDVTDFCKPIDPGIAQCIADHWWEMADKQPASEGLETQKTLWKK